MNTIQSQWERFKEGIPKEVTEEQRNLMKSCFYAGAAAATDIMMKIAEEGISEDAGAEIFQTIIEECLAFAQE